MKLLELNTKKAHFKVKIENADDLWYLSQLIEKNDIISGRTERKIRLDSGDERNVKVTKKHVFLSLEVEKVEFSRYQNWLRVSGKIREAPEDVPKGSYHTFNLEPDNMIEVQKSELLKYQIDRLQDVCKEKETKLLAVVFDREDAIFARIKAQGYEILSEKKGEVEKKIEGVRPAGNFYTEIIKIIEDYQSRYGFENIIVASPAFFKDDLMKSLKSQELKKKIVLATVSSVNNAGIDELIKRPEIKNVLQKNRFAQEIAMVEEVLKEISKRGAVAYGFDECRKACDAGAVKSLLVTDELIMKMREQGNYQELEKMMKDAEAVNGEVHIINSEHNGGKKLDGLGGVAAILRYKMYE